MKKEPRVAANAANAQAKAPDVAPNPAAAAAALAPCEAVIEYRSPEELKPNPRNPRNPRTHSGKQVQLLAAAIKEFEVFVPVVVDENDVILAGHARVEAAKLLGMAKVPTIRVKHLTPERKRAFVLADNRLEAVTAEQAMEQEVAPEPDRKEPAVSALGDLWQLDPHRLFCGSALEEESYRLLLGDERVQMLFSDPPYNVPIDGHVCGLGSVKHAEFKMASGEMSDQEFIAFLEECMRLGAAYSIDGAIHFLCMDWRHMREILAAAGPIFGPAKNVCVWVKTNAGMGTFYRSQHELVFAFKVGTAAHINNFGLGERGRYRSNVWVYPGVNTFKRGRMEELEAHPTVKPLAMVIDALKDCSRRRGIVLDPFVGSGTTLLAAEKTARIGRAIELDPHYVDVAIRRWQALTGRSAIHLGSGRTFDELATQRGREAA